MFLKRFLLLMLVFVVPLLFIFGCDEEKEVRDKNEQVENEQVENEQVREKETAEVVEENFEEGFANLTRHLSMIVDLGEVYTETESCDEIYETALGNQLRSFRFTRSRLTNAASRMEETTPLTEELELRFLRQFTETLRNSYERKDNIDRANQVLEKHLDELRDSATVDYEELIEEKNQQRILEILKEIESGLKPTVEELGINYEDFDPLIDHKLKTIYEYSREEDFQEEIRGEYDLNADGKADDIQVIFGTQPHSSGPGDESSTIRVNNAEIETEGPIHSPMGVYIIDFNEEEPFKELVIYDDGPSASPYKIIYRYSREELIKLGTISGVMGDSVEENAEDTDEDITGGPYYSAIKADGRGNIIQAWNAVEFISPEIIVGVSRIKDEEIEDIMIDYSEMLHKEYEIKEDLNIFFKETDKDMRDIRMKWEEDKIISINEGERIYLEDICDMFPARYAVELEDGRRGVLYFWIGD